jgi:hypothetical protein
MKERTPRDRISSPSKTVTVADDLEMMVGVPLGEVTGVGGGNSGALKGSWDAGIGGWDVVVAVSWD